MDWIEGFVAECQARGLTQHTIESYRSNVKSFLQQCKDPCAVSIDDLKAFLGALRARGLCGNTLKEYFASISAFFDYLVFDGHLQNNPVISFRKRYLRVKHGGENTRQLITVDQMSELINLAARSILDRTMILFLAKTGLRRGELIAMDIHDLNLERMEFRTKPKAKRSNRLGFLDFETSAALREYLDWRESRACDQALWITKSGSRVSRNYIYNTVTHYARIAGLHNPHGAMNQKFTPHCCRHFFTTHLRKNGMSREFIQELRGDRRKDAIDIYDHIDPDELREKYLECIPHLSVGPGRRGTLEEWL